jgi:predicted transposase YdaD
MSTAPWDLPIRMVEYQLSIIAKHRRQYPKDKKIPVVIPLLVYNGKQSPYPKTLDIIKLFQSSTLAQTTFAKPARLIDLTVMSDQTIKKHNIISLLELEKVKFIKQEGIRGH